MSKRFRTVEGRQNINDNTMGSGIIRSPVIKMTFTKYTAKVFYEARHKSIFTTVQLAKCILTFIVTWMFIPHDMLGESTGLHLYNAMQLLLLSPLTRQGFQTYLALKEPTNKYFSTLLQRKTLLFFLALICIYAIFTISVAIVSFLQNFLGPLAQAIVICGIFSFITAIVAQNLIKRGLKTDYRVSFINSGLFLFLATCLFAFIIISLQSTFVMTTFPLSGFIIPIIKLALFVMLLKTTIIAVTIQHKESALLS